MSYVWEQRKLGDTVQITMGQSPDGTTYSDIPSNYILIQGNADLQNGWVVPKIWTSQMTKKADAGDLIMSVRAPAGAMGKTAYNAVIGRGVAAIKGNEFIYQLLVKMDSEGFWKSLSCGSTFGSLNTHNIKNADILIPDIVEQTEIGEYFSNLDRLITLHQRKILLYKYFFTIDWEQRKLEDEVFSIDTGKSKFTSHESGKFEILGSTSVIGYDDSYDYEGDFLLTARVGANAGELYRHFGKVKISDNTVFIQGKYLDFIYYLLLNFGIKKLSFGTGQPLVKASELRKLNILMPINDNEREQIGLYLSKLDNLITLHRCKCIIYRKNMVNAWEQRKLNEICNYKSSSLTVADRTEQGKFPLYDANGQIGMVDSFYMQEDYITVIKDGAGVGRIRRLPKNTAFIGTMGALTSKNSELNFLYYLLEKKDLSKQYTGSTIPHIYFKDYGRNDVLVSDIKEQQKIGLYFDQLDHLITLHQWKCIVCTKIKVNTWIQCKFIKIGVKLQKCILLSIILLFKRRKVSCVFYVNILLRFIKVIELEVELVFVIIDGTIIVMFYLKIRCLYLNIFIFKINK